MNVVIVLLPATAQIYAVLLNGIRRRLGCQYETQTVDNGMESSKIRQLSEFWHPIGYIVVGAEGLDKMNQDAFGKIPVVYLDRTPLTNDSPVLDVVQDYEEGGEAAARELIRADVPHYAFVGFREPASWSDLRGSSFARIVKLHGKTFDRFSEYNQNAKRSVHLEQWLVRLPKPVGVFTANDRTAQEVHTICKRNRIRIPQDLTLLGIDNVSTICEAVEPKISSISTDFELAGWMCADLLLERIKNPRLRKAMRKYPILGVIRRASTICQHNYSPPILRAVNLIRAKACEELTVDDVAAEMNCSRRVAEIRFHLATNQTIKSMITDIRLDRARTLLFARELTVAAIATACGYSSDTALRLAFKKKFGRTLASTRKI